MNPRSSADGSGRRSIHLPIICIATRQRPDWVGRLLESIALTQRRSAGAQSVQIIVCDNDSDQSARAAVARHVETYQEPRTTYVVEPVLGIPQARNAAVRTALSLGADSVIFVDDDEVVEPEWLETLLHCQSIYGADVVAGPVLPRFEDEVPDWVVNGKFFDRERKPTGTPLETPGTGNCIILRSVFDSIGLFDEQMALSGGSDTEFFLRAHAAGIRTIACAEAIAHESVPLSRATARWIVRRAFRNTAGYVRLTRRHTPMVRWFFMRAIKTGGFVVRGVGFLIISSAFGRAHFVHGLQDLARAWGSITGAIGWQGNEYVKVHGR